MTFYTCSECSWLGTGDDAEEHSGENKCDPHAIITEHHEPPPGSRPK